MQSGHLAAGYETLAPDDERRRRRRPPEPGTLWPPSYHFWFPPDGEPCDGCSMFADQIGHLAHINARDTWFALVSRAPSRR
jgi:hypothetical protein